MDKQNYAVSKKAGRFNTGLAQEIDSSFRRHSLSVTQVIQLSHDLAQIESSMYQCFLEHLPDAMLIADADCKIIRVNAAFVAITGYSENEVNAGQTPRLHSSRGYNGSFYDQLWDS